MLSGFSPSTVCGTCSRYFTHLNSTFIRHASIKAGVARGLRASGVEPGSPRHAKTRTRPRRGPNTGAIGQNRETDSRSMRDRREAPMKSTNFGRERRDRDSSSSRSSRDAPARSTGFGQRGRERDSNSLRDTREMRSTTFGGERRQRDFGLTTTRSASDQRREDPYPRREPRETSSRWGNDGERRSKWGSKPLGETQERPMRSTIQSAPYSEQDRPRVPHPFPVPYSTATSVFVPGRRAVESILLARRRQVHKLYLSEQSRSSLPVRHIENEAKKQRIPVERKEQDFIDRVMNTLQMSGIVNDGCLLECSELAYTPLEFLGQADKTSFEYQAKKETRPRMSYRSSEAEGTAWRMPFLLWLHGVVDTRNIAALYRSAVYFGVDAVILSEQGTGRMQPSALRASAGSAEFVQTFIVSDIKHFMAKSKANGWGFLGAMPPAKDQKSSQKINVMAMQGTPVEQKACVLVLGNEDQGLSWEVRDACNTAVTVPAAGMAAKNAGVDSLNVGVAGTLLFSRLLQKPEQLVKTKDDRQRDRERLF